LSRQAMIKQTLLRLSSTDKNPSPCLTWEAFMFYRAFEKLQTAVNNLLIQHDYSSNFVIKGLFSRNILQLDFITVLYVSLF
jgi:hypothetical protein